MTAVMTKRQLLKALSMTDGGGAEVTLQTTIASEIIPLIRQQCFMRQIAEKAGSAINMTKPKIRIPKMVRAQGAYSVKPGAPAPEFKARMEGVDLVPEKLMAWLPIETEVFEDSTIKDLESILRSELANEFSQAEELAFLLGDTSIDNGPGDPRNVFNGLIKQAAATPYTYDTSLDSTTHDSDVLVANLIRAMRYLGIYGRSKRDITILVGLSAEEKLLRSPSFQRMSTYAYGSSAGVFSGELGRLAGAAVVATSFLDAQPGDTYGKCIILNNSSFVIGDWQSFTIRLFDEILSQSDQTALRARERLAFSVRYGEAILSIQNFPAQP